jgi:N utilization substance protein A
MNHEIVESFSGLVREKSIDKDILAGIVEDIFGMMVRKKYGPDAKFDVVVNMDKGDIEIYLERVVVEVVEDPNTQIDVETARKLSGEELEVGEDYVEIIPLIQFGRRLITTAKQNFTQRIKEIEKELIYSEYTNSNGEIVVGEVYQIRNNDLLIMHNKNELLLPRSEQIPKERFKKGDTVRGVVKEVRKNTSGPMVIISRTDPRFLERLFELEIPEVYDGIIEIKSIAREPGERAKVAVESSDDRIDAVGACVGMKGVRIHAIVRELNNENIDVINYTDDPHAFISRALAPAKLKEIKLDKENRKAIVTVAEDQVSMAIGKGGQNIRLASKLSGYDIQLVKEGSEYDIDLVEFKSELGEAVYAKFVEAGYETAKEVIDADLSDLSEEIGLEEDKMKELVDLIKKEYEEAEVDDDDEKDEDDEAESDEGGDDDDKKESGEKPEPEKVSS